MGQTKIQDITLEWHPAEPYRPACYIGTATLVSGARVIFEFTWATGVIRGSWLDPAPHHRPGGEGGSMFGDTVQGVLRRAIKDRTGWRG